MVFDTSKSLKRLVQTRRIFPYLTMHVCSIVVILTDTESNLIYYLTDFVVRRYKSELVWCRFEIAASRLVTSSVEVMIFRLTLKSMGKNRQLFKKEGYTYKYILKLQKAQENMLDKCIHQKVVECVNEILKIYNSLQRF